MNIECVICLESLQPTDAIHNTPCGHVFHYPCVSQWFQRSTSCPECRKKVPNKRLHRIFFNFVSENTIMAELTSMLETNISNLEDQLMVKDNEIAKINAEKQVLSEKNNQLQKEVDGCTIRVDMIRSRVEEIILDLQTARNTLDNAAKTVTDAVEKHKTEMGLLGKDLISFQAAMKDLISPQVQQSTKDSELKN